MTKSFLTLRDSVVVAVAHSNAQMNNRRRFSASRSETEVFPVGIRDYARAEMMTKIYFNEIKCV